MSNVMESVRGERERVTQRQRFADSLKRLESLASNGPEGNVVCTFQTALESSTLPLSQRQSVADDFQRDLGEWCKVEVEKAMKTAEFVKKSQELLIRKPSSSFAVSFTLPTTSLDRDSVSAILERTHLQFFDAFESSHVRQWPDLSHLPTTSPSVPGYRSHTSGITVFRPRNQRLKAWVQAEATPSRGSEDGFDHGTEPDEEGQVSEALVDISRDPSEDVLPLYLLDVFDDFDSLKSNAGIFAVLLHRARASGDGVLRLTERDSSPDELRVRYERIVTERLPQYLNPVTEERLALLGGYPHAVALRINGEAVFSGDAADYAEWVDGIVTWLEKMFRYLKP